MSRLSMFDRWLIDDELLDERRDSPKAPAARAVLARRFDPDQPRNPHDGKWIDTTPGSAIKDALKLAGKIHLGDNETLVGSGKVDADSGGFRIAAIDRDGIPVFRVGFGGEGFGQASRDDNIPAWDGNPASVLSPGERDQLEAQRDLLDARIETAAASGNSALEADLERERDAISERLNVAGEFNQTAEVDGYTLDRMATKVDAAMAEAADLDELERKMDRLERERDKLRADPSKKWTAEEEALWDSLTEQINALKAKGRADTGTVTFTEGVLPGSKWGDIHYEVYLDEPSHVYGDPGAGGGPTFLVGVLPKNDPEWQNGRDWSGTFDLAEWRKILRQIQTMRAPRPGASRAAGHDVTPGHDELHHYWTRGKGLAKWAKSAHPWTTLRNHLIKYVPPGMADRMASKWFEEVFGFAAGSDKNRVMHGKPPRGHRVGPG